MNNSCSADRLPNSDGKVPDIFVKLISKRSNLVSLPIELGIVPLPIVRSKTRSSAGMKDGKRQVSAMGMVRATSLLRYP